METTIFGVGSYPEEPQSEYKTYEVEFNATVHCTARVLAKDSFEAEEELKDIRRGDIDTMNNFQIEEILDVREEDEI